MLNFLLKFDLPTVLESINGKCSKHTIPKNKFKSHFPSVNIGYKIPQIENMGATLDQFDTIDFSDNDLRKLDGFPYLPRMKCLLLNNNRIV